MKHGWVFNRASGRRTPGDLGPAPTARAHPTICELKTSFAVSVFKQIFMF